MDLYGIKCPYILDGFDHSSPARVLYAQRGRSGGTLEDRVRRGPCDGAHPGEGRGDVPRLDRKRGDVVEIRP